MIQGNTLDKTCIEKILKYIMTIDETLLHFNINADDDLASSAIAQLAITQAITNIYESKKHIRQATLDNVNEFDRIRISAARHIASHDYESVNFKVIYDICMKLIDKRVREVLQNEYKQL